MDLAENKFINDKLNFTHPTKQTFSMVIILIIVFLLAYLMYPLIKPIFLSSPYFNGLILIVLIFGTFTCFLQLVSISRSVNWIQNYVLNKKNKNELSLAPRLLVSVVVLFKDNKLIKSVNSSTSRTILDSVGTRLDESRDITRYIINLLIFLGLLGTFFGLATTVPAVVQTIKSLAPKEGQTGIEAFNGLMVGLETQLGGMGTAFSSSLLGLAGSLLVGLLDIFASHSQNRFYMELEEWISSFTRFGLSNSEGENSNNDEMFNNFLIHSSDQLDKLEKLIERGEKQRQDISSQILELVNFIEKIAKSDSSSQIGKVTQNALNTKTLESLSNNQQSLILTLKTQFEENESLDLETKTRLRNIDTHLARIHEEISAGRQDTITELRSDLSSLSSAIVEVIKNNSTNRK